MPTAFDRFGRHKAPNPLPPVPVPMETVTDEVQLHTKESMETQHSIVKTLAREYMLNTTCSVSDAEGKPIFGIDDPDSPLNPRCDKFNARSWATNFAKATKEYGQSFRQVGLCFQNLNVFVYGTPTDFQKDASNVWLALPGIARRFFSSTSGHTRIDILRQLDGLILPGEMLCVLGPPAAGCTTFLKAISGETNGIYISEGSNFNYQGLSAKEMHTAHRGDVIYTAEVDVHFPQLTVGETLTFASRARCPKELPQGIAPHQ